MDLKELPNRLTETIVKDIKGPFFENPRIIDVSIPVYKLSPIEAQELNKKGIVLKWIHKVPHDKGKPSERLYELIGINNRNIKKSDLS